MGSAPVFDQFPARYKTPSVLASQSFPGFGGSSARTPSSRSQITCATNCATPGYSVFLHNTTQGKKKQVFRVCGRCCGQARSCGSFSTGVRRKLLSQGFPGCCFHRKGWSANPPKPPFRGSGAECSLTLSFYRIIRRCQSSLAGRALFPPGPRQTRTRKCTSPGGSSRDNLPGRTPWRRTARRRRHR